MAEYLISNQTAVGSNPTRRFQKKRDNMRFLAFSRQMIETPWLVKLNCNEPYILISINESRNKGYEETRPAESEHHRATLKLYFDDVERKTNRQVPMTNAHAEQILDFVNEHKNDVSLICIQCEWGLEISPPIMEALWFWLNNTIIEEVGHSPTSKHIRRIMQEVIEER